MWRRQRGRCFYCDRLTHTRPPRKGRATDPLMMTVDHVNRVHSEKLAVGACFACNTERGHLPAHEYIMVWAARIAAAEARNASQQGLARQA